MSDKILVIVMSGSENKEKAMMGLNLALHTTVETKVILFGPSEKLAAEGSPDISSLIKQLIDKGSIPIACSNYAEKNKIDSKLLEMKIEMKPVGKVISDYVLKGYAPITF